MAGVPKSVKIIFLSAFITALTIASAHAQQAITTTTVNLGVPDTAAILRRPVTDVLGRSHVGIFIMHPYSSYTNFQGAATSRRVASRRFVRTVLLPDISLAITVTSSMHRQSPRGLTSFVP